MSVWIVAEPLGGWVIHAVFVVWSIQVTLAVALFLAARLSGPFDNAMWYTVIISHLTFLSLLVISSYRLRSQTQKCRRILIWAVFVGFILLLSAVPSAVFIDSGRYPRAVYQQELGSVVAASVAGIMRFTSSYYRAAGVYAQTTSGGSETGSLELGFRH